MLSHVSIAALWSHEEERADLLALVCDVYCDVVTFPFGILGQVWYMTVSIPYPCCLFYFHSVSFGNNQAGVAEAFNSFS